MFSDLVFDTSATQPVAPPAISGGTLLPLADGETVVAADPDRDRVYVVNLSRRAVTSTIVLRSGDEPGRLVEDASGVVHVALRRGGAEAAIDPVAGSVVGRRAVCAAPRGIAYDSATDLLHVACADGELVSLPASGGEAVRTLALPTDLRDVVVAGDVLRVSRFRSAELLSVDAAGTVTGRATLPVFRSAQVRGGQAFSAAVAWRAVAMPDGAVAMVHQRGCDDVIQHGGSQPGGYGSGAASCDSIVHSTVSVVAADGSVMSGPAFSDLPLPVDLAVSPDGTKLAIISAANGHHIRSTSLQVMPTSEVTASVGEGENCIANSRSACLGCSPSVPSVSGEAIAVAFAADGSVMVQTRQPAALAYGVGAIVLATDDRADLGHEIFHDNAGAGLACASCHAEGLDDGRVWNFACVGGRRTQSLQTGLRGTEPFHWNGDEKDFPTLVHDIFTMRMSGPELSADQVTAALDWIDGQPRVARGGAVDATAVARGQAVFTKATCSTCHSGEHLTNGQTVDVGTGGLFQVPSLVGLADHPPYLHNGCAATLADRFDPACGGGDKHGVTSTLTRAELADLVVYLGTL
jgi:DNA-binding beta-propeller fold protein YncE/mono/diheme cytochrome c family protein